MRDRIINLKDVCRGNFIFPLHYCVSTPPTPLPTASPFQLLHPPELFLNSAILEIKVIFFVEKERDVKQDKILSATTYTGVSAFNVLKC